MEISVIKKAFENVRPYLEVPGEVEQVLESLEKNMELDGVIEYMDEYSNRVNEPLKTDIRIIMNELMRLNK